ncbi:TIGR03089 family protein [Leekyejoonella antrihumi]|uniref:TIGR03089 family protein n=1 Tax=Leekyejoonella antrihumi TaxID=1660198 RepID=A0A563DXT4_9MICO|nr:TIGR03089 family protein [Leekyejoonella antrihumi]TWP35070.1 TIGR03089 family protein [Leekyejoonella antrihumi]
MTPADVLALIRQDETAPRVTFYDDTPGQTRGERIELSAKVFANWIAKAANLLQDEFEAAPGTTIGLDLPPQHWRTLYWAMAGWAVGATVTLDGVTNADILVTDDPSRAGTGDLILVTLAALARMSPNPLPSGALDEAAELSTYADHFDAWASPEDSDTALIAGGIRTTYRDLVSVPAARDRRRRYLNVVDAAAVLRGALDTWAADGSVLLIRDPDAMMLDRRLQIEGATPTVG